MNALLAISLYVAAAALCITSLAWAVADLGNIPDRCPKKIRIKRTRPVFMRTGLLLSTSATLVLISVNPLM